VESREEVIDLAIPAADGKTLSMVHAHGEVLSQEAEGDVVRIRARVPASEAARLRKLGLVIET
jgi:hypothetical protein